MKNLIVSLIVTCLIISEGLTQQNKLVEIQIKKNADEYAIVPVGQEGIVAFAELTPGKLTFSRFDTNLSGKYAVECTYNQNLSNLDYFFHDQNLYLLLWENSLPKCQIIRLIVATGLVEKFDFDALQDLDVTLFKAIDNDVYILNRTKAEPALLHLNLITNQTNILSTVFEGKTVIQYMEIDNFTQQLNVGFSKQYKKEYKTLVKSFGKDGEQTKLSEVPAPKNIRQLTSKLTSVSGNEKLIMGTFGQKSRGTSGYSQGMYFSKFSSGQTKPIFTQYFNFSDFKNFFKSFPLQERERKEKQVSRAGGKGNNLKSKYLLLVHDVIEKEDQYIMIAESYYPTFRNNNNDNSSNWVRQSFSSVPWNVPFNSLIEVSSGSAGSSVHNNGLVFLGYQYTHTVVAGFSKDGKLLWDDAFEADDLKQMTLKELVKVIPSPEGIKLIYNFKGKLMSKIISENQLIDAKEEMQITKASDDEKAKEYHIKNIEFWYDNYFLAWGIQRNPDKQIKKISSAKNILFFNKLEY